jgi:hypothetical protein
MDGWMDGWMVVAVCIGKPVSHGGPAKPTTTSTTFASDNKAKSATKPSGGGGSGGLAGLGGSEKCPVRTYVRSATVHSVITDRMAQPLQI